MARFRATATFDVDVVDDGQLQQLAADVMSQFQQGAIDLMEAAADPAFDSLVNVLKDSIVPTGDAWMQATLVTTVAIRKAIQETRGALHCSDAQVDLVTR